MTDFVEMTKEEVIEEYAVKSAQVLRDCASGKVGSGSVKRCIIELDGFLPDGTPCMGTLTTLYHFEVKKI